MQKRFRVLPFVALIAVCASPLWFTRSVDAATALVERFEPLVMPAAAAAGVTPAAGVDASIPQGQVDAARLLMAGTMLFGLAAVVRRTI